LANWSNMPTGGCGVQADQPSERPALSGSQTGERRRRQHELHVRLNNDEPARSRLKRAAVKNVALPGCRP
jgi:hypothetical protein